ncbi:MAG: peptidylprolyl isomerase [Burkholderiaceae bacterium]
MSNLSLPVVTEGAYLTLHYRLTTDDGSDIVTTFDDTPATLLLGQGQLAPSLEACLIGLPEGTTQTFSLGADAAFGPRQPDLVRRVSRTTLEQNSQLGVQYSIGDLVEFAAPAGGRFAGVLREINAESALFDFNHPLAGRPVKFTVHIVGIL